MRIVVIGFLALAPAAASAQGAPNGGAPAAGSYQCYGGAAGNMRLSFTGPGRYANDKGKTGAYTSGEGGRITFTSGPWAGFYGRVLPNGKVGLSSKPDTKSYYMLCERK